MFNYEKDTECEGDGKYLPNEFSTCRIVIQCRSFAGDTSAIGYDVGQETSIVIGLGCTYIACAIDHCLQTMKDGERCTVAIKFKTEADNQVHCLLELRLLSFEPHTGVHKLSPSAKLAYAAQLKEIGAAAFRAGDIHIAFYKFSRSLKYATCAAYDPVASAKPLVGNGSSSDVQPLTTTTSATEANPQAASVKAERNRLSCQCWLNLAACQLRYSNYESAKINCSRALHIEPDNVKGLFRRAQCLLKLNDKSAAVGDLEHALAIDPENREVAKLLQVARAASRQSDTTLANAMSKMFH